MNIRNALSGLVAGLVLLMAGNVNAQLVRPAQPCDSLYVSNNLDVANTIHAFSSTGDDLGDFAALGKIARGLVFDPAGNLYAGIPSIPGEIRKITPAGAVSLFA
ncbi:MAG: hypothetical protein OEQ28_08295, partial [Acidobacteriota bacterium]|nr:hypothetical protein [Acidobacteriota bacterium]